MPISNPSAAKTRTVKTGSYVGNANASQDVGVGFKCSLVLLCKIIGLSGWWSAIIMPSACIVHGGTSPYNGTGDASIHAFDGFTVTDTINTVLGGDKMNSDTIVVWYYAISE